jgi:hypothetical protein
VILQLRGIGPKHSKVPVVPSRSFREAKAVFKKITSLFRVRMAVSCALIIYFNFKTCSMDSILEMSDALSSYSPVFEMAKGSESFKLYFNDSEL